jgi:hypothetical protein
LADAGIVEVTDPTHPLYGRQFPIHSISHPGHGPGHVFVVYRENVHFRIPLTATNLSSCPRPTYSGKLTLESIRQFLLLVQEYDTPCPSNPTLSGTDSPRP